MPKAYTSLANKLDKLEKVEDERCGVISLVSGSGVSEQEYTFTWHEHEKRKRHTHFILKHVLQ